jgi:hypothetical protein
MKAFREDLAAIEPKLSTLEKKQTGTATRWIFYAC